MTNVLLYMLDINHRCVIQIKQFCRQHISLMSEEKRIDQQSICIVDIERMNDAVF